MKDFVKEKIREDDYVMRDQWRPMDRRKGCTGDDRTVERKEKNLETNLKMNLEMNLLRHEKKDR